MCCHCHNNCHCCCCHTCNYCCHCMHYCSVCNCSYCCKCGYIFYQGWSYGSTFPVINTLSGGTSTVGNTCNHVHK